MRWWQCHKSCGGFKNELKIYHVHRLELITTLAVLSTVDDQATNNIRLNEFLSKFNGKKEGPGQC